MPASALRERAARKAAARCAVRRSEKFKGSAPGGVSSRSAFRRAKGERIKPSSAVPLSGRGSDMALGVRPRRSGAAMVRNAVRGAVRVAPTARKRPRRSQRRGHGRLEVKGGGDPGSNSPTFLSLLVAARRSIGPPRHELMSSPSISTGWLTRTPTRMLVTIRITMVAIPHHTMVATMPHSCVRTWAALPSIRPCRQWLRRRIRP